MSLQKKEIIKNYLLDEKLSVDEKLERLEIAWDIWEYLEEIKSDLKQIVLEKLDRKIKDEFPRPKYRMVNQGFFKGGIGFDKELRIFKPEWILEGDKGILSYSLGADGSGFSKLYLAISKYDESRPFVGDWRDLEKDEIRGKISVIVQEGKLNNWETGKLWIAWRYFDSPYDSMGERRFFEEIIKKSKGAIEEGCETVANYYFNKLLGLKEATEKLIDEFVELYRSSKV